MKQRKLNIVPFLNEKLAPVGEVYDGRKYVNKYPLYYRITYSRQNTMIKSNDDNRYDKIESVPKKIVNKEIDELNSLIYVLTDGFTDDFDLKGLKQKYDFGLLKLRHVIDEYIRGMIKKYLNKIENPLAKTISVGKYSEDYPLSTLLDACKMLLPSDYGKIIMSIEDDIRAYKFLELVYPPKKVQPTVISWLKDSKIDDKFEIDLRVVANFEGKRILVKDIKNAKDTITSIIFEKL